MQSPSGMPQTHPGLDLRPFAHPWFAAHGCTVALESHFSRDYIQPPLASHDTPVPFEIHGNCGTPDASRGRYHLTCLRSVRTELRRPLPGAPFRRVSTLGGLAISKS